MAAIGVTPVLYEPAAGDASCFFTSSLMPSYFSHGHGGVSSTTSSSPASSYSAALSASPVQSPMQPAIADYAGQLDMPEYLFDHGLFAALPPNGPLAPIQQDGSHGVPGASATTPTHARGAAEPAAMERPRTERIAFRMKSEIEILDDGYKWRKYGKKSVKNSPNPRNYYRCSTEGCDVKKRVERDRDDTAYVVTTYEGTHTHVSPSTVYYASQDAASGRFFVAGTHPPPGSLD
ncbi:probable WRKY transcription factor 57 [Lolium rigidum]|uniref:probable WRKY transcription factor 57 n=1 Tax=Lolium rigidum TaxID=89674 RepID=UPI001F5D6519|nr:probable WRKY transcription factor 57 [Lolium rigidum]